MNTGTFKYIGTIIEGYNKNFDSGRSYFITNDVPGQYSVYDTEGGRLIETIGLRTFNKCFEGLNLQKKKKSWDDKMMELGEEMLTRITSKFASYDHEWLTHYDTELKITLDGNNADQFFYVYYEKTDDKTYKFYTVLMRFDGEEEEELDWIDFNLYEWIDLDNSSYPLRDMIAWIQTKMDNQLNEGLNLPKKGAPPIELTSELLPIVDVCMYNTNISSDSVIYDPETMSYEGSEKYWEYFDFELYNNFILEKAKTFINKWVVDELKELGIGIMGVVVHKIVSPKYYNYGCDKLYYDLTVTSGFLHLIRTDIDKQNTIDLDNYLHEAFSSHPGYLSFMPNSIEDLKEGLVEGGDDVILCVAAYLTYLLKDKFEEWQTDFEQSVTENHSDFDFLREDTPKWIIENMLEELNGYEVDWTDPDDEQINEGLNLPKKSGKSYQQLVSMVHNDPKFLAGDEAYNFVTEMLNTYDFPNEDYGGHDDRYFGYYLSELNDGSVVWTAFDNRGNDLIIEDFPTEHQAYEWALGNFDVFDRCSNCNGAGCEECNNTGYQLNEGLNLPKKKIPAQFNEPTEVILYPEGSIFTMPYHVVKTLENNNIVFWDDEFTPEKPDGQWGINEENESILQYFEQYQKLPPMYNDNFTYIKKGDDVIVDNDFQASVDGFRGDIGEYVTVVDADDDYFDVDPHQLTLDE